MAIEIEIDAFPGNEALNALFCAAWSAGSARDFSLVLAHSLAHICAFEAGKLVGFVNLAWDGGDHGFILDTSVHPDWQRRGIATLMVKRAVALATERKLQWLHVDFEPHLAGFYAGCGFRPSAAGVLRLGSV